MIDEHRQSSRSFIYWNGLIQRSKVYRGALHHTYFSHLPWDGYHRKIFSMISDPADYLFCASIWVFEDILQTRLDDDPMGLNPYAVFRYNRALHLAACMEISEKPRCSWR